MGIFYLISSSVVNIWEYFFNLTKIFITRSKMENMKLQLENADLKYKLLEEKCNNLQEKYDFICDKINKMEEEFIIFKENIKNEDEFISAIKRNDIKKVKQYLKNEQIPEIEIDDEKLIFYLNINDLDDDGFSVLWNAVVNNDKQLINILLKSK